MISTYHTVDTYPSQDTFASPSRRCSSTPHSSTSGAWKSLEELGRAWSLSLFRFVSDRFLPSSGKHHLCDFEFNHQQATFDFVCDILKQTQSNLQTEMVTVFESLKSAIASILKSISTESSFRSTVAVSYFRLLPNAIASPRATNY